MIKKQNFKTASISIDVDGINLYNNWKFLQHIEFNQIEYIDLKKYRTIKNWLFVSFIGILLAVIFLYNNNKYIILKPI